MAPKTRQLKNLKIRKFAFTLWRLNLDFSKASKIFGSNSSKMFEAIGRWNEYVHHRSMNMPPHKQSVNIKNQYKINVLHPT